MQEIHLEVTKRLVQINTIKIQLSNPFTWASGWKAPIYCDNRKLLSYPDARTFVRDQFIKIINEKYPQAEVIAGVATGAIAIGMLVAQELGLPFIYVRSKPKGHGLENLIEGDLKPDDKVIVIEDLVSTGVSSLKASEAISNFGGEVLGMLAIFTYNFPIAKENFENAAIELTTLSRYKTLLEVALESGDINESELESLNQWRQDPANWGK